MNAKRLLVLAIAVVSLVGVLGFTPPASAGVRVGIGIGLPVFFPPPPLRAEVVYRSPGPGYAWVNGYWDWRPAIRNYVWVGGRWAQPGFRDAFWVGPRFVGGRYYAGYWGHGRGGFRGHERGGFRGHGHFHRRW